MVIVPDRGKTFKSNFASEPAPPSRVSVGAVVYPSPPPVTVIPVMVPDFLLNTGVSCASVVGLPPSILIVGKIEYPLPALVTVTESIAYPRTAVPTAPVPVASPVVGLIVTEGVLVYPLPIAPIENPSSLNPRVA